MQVFEFIFQQTSRFYDKLNEYQLAGVPIGIVLVSFLITSIIISVFWKGGRG